jgi:hypothetical protein
VIDDVSAGGFILDETVLSKPLDGAAQGPYED